MHWIAAALVVLLAPITGKEERARLVVEVGQTESRDVGYAMGHLCDDQTIVRASMENGTKDNNVFVVTGLQPGTTLCRVGTMQHRPSILYEVVVVPVDPKR